MAEENAKPERTALLCLTSHDLQPEQVTAALGVRPTHSWQRGEMYGSERPAKVGGWELASSCPSGEKAAVQIRDILGRLRCSREEFRRARSGVEQCYLLLDLNLSEAVPIASCVVPPDLLGELRDLGIELVFTACRYGEAVTWDTDE